jgi:hypothetical protein
MMARKRKQRCEKGQRETGERVAKRRPLSGSLVEMRVETETQKDYMRVRRFFNEWLEATGEKPTDTAAVDELTERYANHVYRTGDPAYRVLKLKAALELENPRTKDRWPILAAAAAGFRRMQETSSWPPLPAELALAAAVLLWGWGRKQSAVAVLTAFHCYLRIGEVVGLTSQLVCLPGDASLATKVKPSLTVLKAKTGKLQSVFVECPLVMALLLQIRGAGTLPRQKLFEDLTPEKLRDDLRDALVRLQVPNATAERYVFHSLRHGGAAHDFHSGNRTFAQVQERGRWKSEDCCRLYVQRARVWLILEGVPGKIKGPLKELVLGHHGKRFGLPRCEARFAHL